MWKRYHNHSRVSTKIFLFFSSNLEEFFFWYLCIYLDTNLIYYNTQHQCIPLTPAAGRAMLVYLQDTYLKLEKLALNDMLHITNSHSIAEVDRSFKRVFYKTLLLHGKFDLKTTKIDQSDHQTTIITCTQSLILPKPTKGI
jgi:hypothetical protein